MTKLAVAALGLLALSACVSAAPQAGVGAVRLYALDCGHVRVADADCYADDGSFAGVPGDLVVPCCLVRHPKGDFIWNAGLPDAIRDRPGGAIVSGGDRISVTTKLVDQLAQLNLAPADIEFLSISHSHFDHVGNAGLFTNATWIVDPDERAWMFRPEARTDEDFPQVAPLEQFRTTTIAGDGDHDVFGDGSVVIVQAPGHTPGHRVLLVRLAHAGPVLLTGDMRRLAQSRARRTVPRFNTDRAQTLASMDKVEALAQRASARVIREHVPVDFTALPKFPAALN